MELIAWSYLRLPSAHVEMEKAGGRIDVEKSL
jgi:hypothetical protein